MKDAVRAFERAGFKVVRQSGHVIMSNGVLTISIPRATPAMLSRWRGSSLTPG
jgi:hypothetical protein